jgi:PiT family inorganic phosphate transporter
VIECQISSSPIWCGGFVPYVFLAVALAFILVSGVNDGGSLLALGSRHPDVPLAGIVALLGGTLVLAPLLAGDHVAMAFTPRLGDVTEGRGRNAFLVGATVALLVVLALAATGVPTSLTLALVGGIAGAGAGAGLAVPWGGLTTILVIGMAAPLVGSALAYLFLRLSRRAPGAPEVSRRVRRAHLATYVLQCVAYAVNDGQKMFAVAGVALSTVGIGALGGGARLAWWALLACCAVLFTAAALVNVHTISGRIGRDLLLLRPLQTVAVQAAASLAVLGSAGLGTPVSMTQSMSGGIVGAGVSSGWRRVRWHEAARIAVAWIVTLPSSFAIAAAAGLVTGRLS